MRLFAIATAITAGLLVATTAQAEMVLDFAGGGQQDAEAFEVTDAGDATHTINETTTSDGTFVSWTPTSEDNDSSFETGNGAAGPLTGASGSLAWDVISTNSWSLDGSNNLTTGSLVNITRNAGNGWGVANGGSTDVDDTDLIGFDFDLSGLTLPPLMELRITQLTTSGNGSSAAILAVIDGVGSTSVSPSGTDAESHNIYDLAIDVTDGSRIGFTHEGTGDFRIDTMTLTVIPEPTTAALIGLGAVALTIRRRRRA